MSRSGKLSASRRVLHRASGVLCAVVAAFALSAVGCGMGVDPTGSASAAQVVAGLPPCDASLLHPHMTVGASASLPGKLVVYVDGVMACLDDSNRVDQLLTQIE